MKHQCPACLGKGKAKLIGLPFEPTCEMCNGQGHLNVCRVCNEEKELIEDDMCKDCNEQMKKIDKRLEEENGTNKS